MGTHFRFILLLLLAVLSPPSMAMDTPLLQQLLASVVPQRTVLALALIPDQGRKLLAARGYLRSADRLDSRWSWNEQEIEDFQGSEKQAQLLADIARVNDAFSAENPGYQVFVNSNVRSLDQQIAKWNRNASVGVAAADVWAQFQQSEYDSWQSIQQDKLETFRQWLVTLQIEARSNLAAPGLSRHGRMHAIDFQIQSDNGVIVAAADSKQISEVWSAQGWARKLKRAIITSATPFEGPLTKPYEPWHYRYLPQKTKPEHR